MEIVMRILVLLLSRMNFDYKENGGRTAFLENLKHEYVYPNMESTIVVPNHKKSVHNYENPCLTHLIDKL